MNLNFFFFFEDFERNLDHATNQLFLRCSFSDFSVKSNNWYCHDKFYLLGNTVDNATNQYGLHEAMSLKVVTATFLFVYF